MTPTTYQLSDRYAPEATTIALSGVQALVRLLVEQQRADRDRDLRTAGLVSGYRGSPLGGLDLQLTAERDLLAGHDIEFVPGVNEELAATVIAGSQLTDEFGEPTRDGVFGLWYGKSPGVDRAGDAFKHGNWMGASRHGGVLVVAGDDPAAKSSTLPNTSEAALVDAWMPVLTPATIAEVVRLGRIGFEMSRYSRSWVSMRLVVNLADGYDVVPAVPVEVAVPGNSPLPAGPPADRAAREREVLDARLAAALAVARLNDVNRVEIAAPQARTGIIAAGRTAVEVRHALARLGLTRDAMEAAGCRFLQLGMVHPLDGELVARFADGLDEILVVEEKAPLLEARVRDALYGGPSQPRVIGKTDAAGDALVPYDGELNADRLRQVLAAWARERFPEAVAAPSPAGSALALGALPLATDLPARGAFFCSGCPHNRSTVVPDGAVAAGGIGCHGMTGEMGRTAGGLLQMGGEGAQWVGAAPFTSTPHLFQNIGDGTFFHSGSLAIRQAVAAGTNITFKLLYNAAVAMTGGQPVDGAIPVPALTRMLAAEGVSRIVVVADEPDRYSPSADFAPGVTIHHRDELEAVQDDLRQVPGVSVLVYDQVCAAEARRKRRRGRTPTPARRAHINTAVCEGCGHCGAVSNCLSVEPVDTPLGRKTQIDQTSCNYDFSCLLGDCPSFLTVEPAGDRAATPRQAVEIPTDLPDPSSPQEANLLLVGIGGTGVVTVNQILATAALLDGRAARGLDQTGLSQKGGAVVSHLRITTRQQDLPGALGQGETDVLLAFDSLAAAAVDNLRRCSPTRTRVVASTTKVPTGRMVTDTSELFPDTARLLDRLGAVARPDAPPHYLDAQDAATRLFDTATTANILLVGVAYQAGLLPLSAAAIEGAIGLNGVVVDTNLQAFRAGRAALAHPDWFATAVAPAAPAAPAPPPALVDLLADLPEDLRAVVDHRAAQLVDYQSVSLARSYLHTVREAREREQAVAGARTELSQAVATSLHRLLAYKDEYEVARLLVSHEAQQEVEATFGDASRVRYHLHPPFLRAMGMDRKIAFGPWIRPVLRLLAGLRRVRGTRLDLFGLARVRRLERQLPAEYRDLVSTILEALGPDTYDDAVELAGLADVIRGYEGIKLANVDRYRAEVAARLPSLQALHAGGVR